MSVTLDAFCELTKRGSVVCRRSRHVELPLIRCVDLVAWAPVKDGLIGAPVLYLCVFVKGGVVLGTPRVTFV